MINQGENDFAAWLGIDWADEKHAWAMRVQGEPRIQSGELDHTPEKVEAFFTELAVQFPGLRIAVALEQRRGALVYILGKYEHVVLFSIHPNTLQEFPPVRRQKRSRGRGAHSGSAL